MSATSVAFSLSAEDDCLLLPSTPPRPWSPEERRGAPARAEDPPAGLLEEPAVAGRLLSAREGAEPWPDRRPLFPAEGPPRLLLGPCCSGSRQPVATKRPLLAV